MSRIKKYKFGDIVLPNGMIRGPFGSALKKSLFVPKASDTYKVYEQGVVLEQNKNVGRYYISKEYFENNLKRFEVKENDFLVSCSGVNYGAIYQLKGTFEQGVINQALLIIRVNPLIVDYNYFLYYFRSFIVKAITSGTGDSTIPNFPSMSVIKDIEVMIPDICIQRKIGKILSCIDNKIKLNNAVNNDLQSMAYVTYMHLFFGKQVNGKLADILIENPKSPIQVSDAKGIVGGFPFFTSGDAVLKWAEALVEGRNCYLNTGGNAGVKYYVGKAAYSTDTWCITAKYDLSDYLYLFLESIKPELNKKYFQGTGLKHLQKPLLKERPIYIPSKNEVEAFNRDVQPWLSMISDNNRESQQLTALKDWLLPMLMNGQAVIAD